MAMSKDGVLDIERLRRSCGRCTLRELCLPAGIGAVGLEQLDTIVRRRPAFARHEYVFTATSAAKALYIPSEGAFKTVVLAEDGERQVVGFHLPGEVMGLDAIGTGYHRCEAEALEPSRVCEVPLEDLERIAAQVPALQRQLLGLIGRSMGRKQDHLEMMGRRAASDRVLLFLHSMAGRYRALGHPEGVLALPMSREDIANYLGLVVETVSRSFSHLQKQGLITVRSRDVRILDPARFANQAHAAIASGGHR